MATFRVLAFISFCFQVVTSSAIPKADPHGLFERAPSCDALAVKVVDVVLTRIGQPASTFCSSYIHAPTEASIITVQATTTSQTTTTLPQPPASTVTNGFATTTDSTTVYTTETSTTTTTSTITPDDVIATSITTTVSTSTGPTPKTTVTPIPTYSLLQQPQAKRANQIPAAVASIESQLAGFARNFVTSACSCFITTFPAVTSTLTSTTVNTNTVNGPAAATVTVPSSTTTFTNSVTSTTTTTTTLVSKTTLVAETSTTVSTTTSITVLTPPTSTVTAQQQTATFTAVQRGANCVYNHYKTIGRVGTTDPAQGTAICAQKCANDQSCVFFAFVVYLARNGNPPFGECFTDAVPYNPTYLQCSSSSWSGGNFYNLVARTPPA